MGRTRSTEHDEIIRNMSSTSTLQEMASATGKSRDAVRRSLIAQGLPFKQSLTTRGSCKLEPHFEEIKQLYDGGCSLTLLTQKFDCDWNTLRKFMKSNGLESRKGWSRNSKGKQLTSIPAEKVQTMVQRYKEQGQTLKDIASEFGICKVSARKILMGEGVVLREAHTRKKTDDEKLTTVLRRGYKVDVSWYKNTLEKQNHRCPICGCVSSDSARNRGKVRFSVDHDHVTGCVRGLLCSSCNVGMGYFSDSPSLLQKAADYLNSFVAPISPCLTP